MLTRTQPWLAALLCASLVLGDGLALALYYALFASLLITRSELTRDARAILLAHGVFLAWAVLTVLLARHGHPRSGEATLPLAWGGAVVGALAFSGDARTQLALRLLAVATLVVSLFGIGQYLFDLSVVGVWLRRPPDRLSVPVPGDITHAVASGFFFNRLKLAFTLGATLPLLAFVWRTRALYKLVVCSIGATALFLAFSRSAMAALVCSLAAGALCLRRIPATSIFLAAPLLHPSLRDRLASALERSSYSDRAFIWARALEMWRDNPITGVGFGNYPRVCQPYYDAVDPSFPMRTHAHDQWLSLLTETGPIGVVLFAAWLFFIARAVWRQRSADSARYAAGVAIAVNLLVIMLVHDPLQHSASGLAFCCALGMAISDGSAATDIARQR